MMVLLNSMKPYVFFHKGLISTSKESYVIIQFIGSGIYTKHLVDLDQIQQV